MCHLSWVYTREFARPRGSLVYLTSPCALLSVVKVSSTAHNDCYLGRLAESLQELKRLNCRGMTFPALLSVVKVSSTAHNDCYLGRLAESLQELKRLNSRGMTLPGNSNGHSWVTRFSCVQCKRANATSAAAASFPRETKFTCEHSFSR